MSDMKLSEKMEKKVAFWAALSEASRLNQKPVVVLIRQWVSDAQKLEGSLEHVRGELDAAHSLSDGGSDGGEAFIAKQERVIAKQELEAVRQELANAKERNLTLVASKAQARRDRDEALETIAKLEGANDSLSWVIEKFVKSSEPE